MTTALSAADDSRAELDALRPIDPAIMAKVNQKLKLDYNYHSNSLEGNSLTRQETQTLLMNAYTPRESKPLQDVEEMRGHIEAVEVLGLLEGVVKDGQDVSEKLIRELNGMILVRDHKKRRYDEQGEALWATIKVGEYKTKPNHVETATGEKFRFTEPGEATKAEMSELLAWYRGSESLHPVTRAATLHYKFIRIHPFDDGNGRVARLLMNLVLQRAGYAIAIISSELGAKERYYQALRTVDATLPELHVAVQAEEPELFEPFVEYIAGRVQETMELMIRAAKGEEIFTAEDALKQLEVSLRSEETAEKLDYERVVDAAAVIINRLDQFGVIYTKQKFMSLVSTPKKLRYRFSDKSYRVEFGSGQVRSQQKGDLRPVSESFELLATRIQEEVEKYSQGSNYVSSKLLAQLTNLQISTQWNFRDEISQLSCSFSLSVLIQLPQTRIAVMRSSPTHARLGEVTFETLAYDSPEWINELAALMNKHIR